MRTLLFSLSVLVLVGCKGIHPVGPLAKKVPITQQGQELPKSPTDPAIAARAASGKHTPPTEYIKPEDVTVANVKESAAKFAAELQTDMKASANAPVTVEVSRPKVR